MSPAFLNVSRISRISRILSIISRISINIPIFWKKILVLEKRNGNFYWFWKIGTKNSPISRKKIPTKSDFAKNFPDFPIFRFWKFGLSGKNFPGRSSPAFWWGEVDSYGIADFRPMELNVMFTVSRPHVQKPAAWSCHYLQFFQKVVIILLFWRFVKISNDQNKRPGVNPSKDGPRTALYGPTISLKCVYLIFVIVEIIFPLATYFGLSP